MFPLCSCKDFIINGQAKTIVTETSLFLEFEDVQSGLGTEELKLLFLWVDIKFIIC